MRGRELVSQYFPDVESRTELAVPSGQDSEEGKNPTDEETNARAEETRAEL
jgi:hypothetical protein